MTTTPKNYLTVQRTESNLFCAIVIGRSDLGAFEFVRSHAESSDVWSAVVYALHQSSVLPTHIKTPDGFFIAPDEFSLIEIAEEVYG